MTKWRGALPPPVSRPWIAFAVVAWVIAAVLSPVPTPLDLGEDAYHGPVVLTTDILEGRFGPWAIGEVDRRSVLVGLDGGYDAGRGDTLQVFGRLMGEPGTAAGRAYGSVLTVREVSSIARSRFLPHRAGRVVRDRVVDRLTPFDDGRALLAGFLIGETAEITEADVEAMRRSGLAHFVAVSGSNVALFLALLAIAAGPLALGPKRRAALGLIALPVYAAATRFEPSVMRAAVMAALALGGRLAGVVFEAWQLLSLTVAALVLVDPAMTSNVGFQLSVAATGGVLIGGRWPVAGLVPKALAITLGAQLAVAPLLLAHFGTVPVMSPLVNLIAAPLVAMATITGAVGVAGIGFLVPLASWLARLVLALARGAAGWPQVSTLGFAVVLLAIALVAGLPRSRPAIAITASVLVVLAVSFSESPVPHAGVVVLDVGQGDSILIHGGDGRFALVDGGPDPLVVVDKLREYGVTEIELMVMTHVHADHAAGLVGVVDAVSVGQMWADPGSHSSPAATTLFDAIQRRGIPISAPHRGEIWNLGSLELIVEGPLRRYASPNDQSIVLTVRGPEKTVLLAGDIETYAQADLGHLRADVLKVPHQGAATSDPKWLTQVGSELAVVSVGPNQFGHPAEWVLDVLSQSNEVLRTDEVGDIVVDLAGAELATTVAGSETS